MEKENMNSGETGGGEGRITGSLLNCGTAAGGLYVIMNFIQAFTRAGFDIMKHPISNMINGSHGWIQRANFILTGLLAFLCAFGIRRALHPGKAGTWGPILFGAFGIGLAVAGTFGPDPSLGFPPGAPEGIPATMSWHSSLHALGFFTCALSVVAAGFVFMRRFISLKEWGWALYCLLTSLGVPVLIAISSSRPYSNGMILIGVMLLLSGFIASIPARLKGRVGNA